MGLLPAAVRRKLKENLGLLKDFVVVDEEGQGMVIINKKWFVNDATQFYYPSHLKFKSQIDTSCINGVPYDDTKWKLCHVREVIGHAGIFPYPFLLIFESII